MPKVRSITTHISHLDDLTPDPQNANLGTVRGREAVAQSLREFGPGRAVLIDRHGNVIAGNMIVAFSSDVGRDETAIRPEVEAPT